jgi:hypothetical protein
MKPSWGVIFEAVSSSIETAGAPGLQLPSYLVG